MLILLSKMRIHSCSDETVRVKTQSGTQDFGYGHIITQVSPFVLNISQQVNMIIMKITFIFLLARTYLKILYPYPACTRSLVYCTLQYTVNSYVEYCTVYCTRRVTVYLCRVYSYSITRIIVNKFTLEIQNVSPFKIFFILSLLNL